MRIQSKTAPNGIFLKPEQLVGPYKKMGEAGYQFLDLFQNYADLWGNRNGKVDDVKEAEDFIKKAEVFLESAWNGLPAELGIIKPVKDKKLSRQEARDFFHLTSLMLELQIKDGTCKTCDVDRKNAELNAKYASQIQNSAEVWPQVQPSPKKP